MGALAQLTPGELEQPPPVQQYGLLRGQHRPLPQPLPSLQMQPVSASAQQAPLALTGVAASQHLPPEQTWPAAQ